MDGEEEEEQAAIPQGSNVAAQYKFTIHQSTLYENLKWYKT